MISISLISRDYIRPKTSMEMRIVTFVLLASVLLSQSFLCSSIEDDMECLQGLRKSLVDPSGNLRSWTFTNSSVASICKLTGVSCWNEEENRLISIHLQSMELSGSIPEPLKFCRSLQTLDLSRNELSGPIPLQICSWLPYLVTLDLSGNRLSGSIPSQLVNCKFLNSLNLDGNRLSGSIPFELGRLDRLKDFSVANNDLSGQIPSELGAFPKEGFLGNDGLCGGALGSKCDGKYGNSPVVIVAAGVIGAAVSLVLGFGLWWWLFVRVWRRRRRELGGDGEGEGKNVNGVWVVVLRAHRLVQVSLFQKPIVKLRLNDLLKATSNFDSENIEISTPTGVSYKAVLPDGSALAVKRLRQCRLGDKQFRSEVHRLGQLRHPNLVPLLGFCVVADERLLVYKHMYNGTLRSQLTGSGKVNSQYGFLDWSTRLRIGVGAARGLVWLHHTCTPPHVHQAISSSVILLDYDFEARVTDFGLARLARTNEADDSLQQDVHDFGVVLLELVAGSKRLVGQCGGEGLSLVDRVCQMASVGRTMDAVDDALAGKGDDDEILRLMKIACTCVASRPDDRPSMRQVYGSLKAVAEKHSFSDHREELQLTFGRQ